MPKCPKCQSEVEAGKKFCPECGEPLSRQELVTVELRKTEDRFESAITSTGRYKVKKLLGRGGMGVVYQAIDKELGIEVAIKSLPPELSSDLRGLNQLRQEAKLSMQLTHHNIVRLYDLKEAQDFRLLVMEYVEGFSLSDYLFHREKLKEEEAWEILKQVASALDYAHSQKVIHRDIKPSNILFKTNLTVSEMADYFAREGKFPEDLVIKVADFGIARTVSDSMSRLSNLPISGTLTYMSSEQIRGKRQTPATDIYSLGVVAYELLAGHPPFYQGEITYQILNEPPELIPEVKPEYMQAILIALSKNPEDRPKSCKEFIELPKKLSQEKSLCTLAPSPAPSEPEQEKKKIATGLTPPVMPRAKKTAPLWLSLGIIVLVLALGISGYFSYQHFKPKPGSTVVQKPEPKPESPPAPEPPPQPEPTPASITPPAEPSQPSPSPQALLQAKLVWRVGNNLPELAHKGKLNAVCINPAGTLLASGGEDQTIKLWSLPSGKLVKSWQAHSREINSLAFSPSGALLASGAKDGKIKLWTIPSGKLDRTIDSGLGTINSVCFSPDGKLLASAGLGSIKIWKVANGELYKKLGSPLFTPSGSLAFSPNGKLLASAGINYVIKLWDLENGEDISTMRGPVVFGIYSLAFSPSGALLASAGSDKNIKIWGVKNAKLYRTLTAHKKAVTALAFSPSGKVLASASLDETIKLWKVQTGEELRSISAHPINSLSALGKYLASAGCPEKEGTSCQLGELRLYQINW